MKTKFIASTLLAIAAVTSGAAFASTNYGTTLEADAVTIAPTVSTLTRGEVSNQTAAWNKTNYANNSESIVASDVDAVPTTAFVSKTSRDDVRTETARWNKTHYSENLESVTVSDSN